MKTELGLWIDHKEAFIASTLENSEVKRIASDIEKHVRFGGNAADNSEEDIRDRRFDNHLQKYYDEVIATIRHADSILILGPGEAKIELKKRLESQHLGERIVGIETLDKMSDRQISAKVREHFSVH